MTIGTMIRRAALLASAALAAVALAAPAFAQKTKLTVYTALENDQLEPFKKAFEADNPNIEIAWVRDSTGVVAAKLIAEKDNPRADIIWGLAASNVGAMAAMGMLEPYTPAGASALKPAFSRSSVSTPPRRRRARRPSRRAGPISPSPSTRTRSSCRTPLRPARATSP